MVVILLDRSVQIASTLFNTYHPIPIHVIMTGKTVISPACKGVFFCGARNSNQQQCNARYYDDPLIFTKLYQLLNFFFITDKWPFYYFFRWKFRCKYKHYPDAPTCIYIHELILSKELLRPLAKIARVYLISTVLLKKVIYRKFYSI